MNGQNDWYDVFFLFDVKENEVMQNYPSWLTCSRCIKNVALYSLSYQQEQSLTRAPQAGTNARLL